MIVLNEDTRQELISKSKHAKKERDGKNRYEKRLKSRIVSSVREYNSMDMNKLFRDDILTVNVPVKGETDNYLVKISFGGFCKILRDKIEQNGGKLELRDVVQALTIGFNKGDVYVYCTCLHPDTKIRLVDGRVIRVEDMEKLFNDGEELWVYSANDDGDIIPCQVEKVWCTGVSYDFVRVVLNNGEIVETTPYHPYMMLDGTYKQACDLLPGMFLGGCLSVKEVYNIKKNCTPVYDIKVKGVPNFMVDAGVILHNCPDNYYRLSYWNTQNKVSSGDPQTIPSPITNPHDDLGRGCKHIMLVLSNAKFLVKTASVIYNYINYMEKHYEKLYADVIYPAIYGKEYGKDVQLPMDDEEPDSPELINRANQAAREKNQFKKGNQSGIQFAKEQEEEPEQLEI